MGTVKYPVCSQTSTPSNALADLINYGSASFGVLTNNTGTIQFRYSKDSDNLSKKDIKSINSVKLYFNFRESNSSSISQVYYKKEGTGSSYDFVRIAYSSATDNATTDQVITASYNTSAFKTTYLNGDFDIKSTFGNIIISNMYILIEYTLNTYTVTFKDHDGTTLKTYTVDSGTKIGDGTSYTYPTPTNYQDNYYIYTNGRYENINTTVTANATYYPTYDKTEKKYQVNLTQSTGGTVTAQDTSGNQSQSSISVGYNQQVTLKAVANEGFKFKHWKDDTSNTKAERAITVTTNGATYEAVFVSVVPKITSISWDIGADHLIAGTGVTTLTVTVEEVEE